MTGQTLNATGVSSDNSPDVLDSFSVPAGEIWYVDEYAGYVRSDASSGTSQTHSIAVRVTTPAGREKASATLCSDNQWSSGSFDEYTGSLGAYAYGGETVELVESSDELATSNDMDVTAEIRQVTASGDFNIFEGSGLSSDGSPGDVDTLSVPAGETWLAGEFIGFVNSYGDSGSSQHYDLDISVEDDLGTLRSSETILHDYLWSSSYDEYSGSLGSYAYGGETIKVHESRDELGTASDYDYYAVARRIA